MPILTKIIHLLNLPLRIQEEVCGIFYHIVAAATMLHLQSSRAAKEQNQANTQHMTIQAF